MSVPLSMADVNALDRDAFVARFGGVYEHSPWVAEGAWQVKPFADRQALEQAMQAVVRAAGPERQLALLRAHPRLGTRTELTEHSRAEQASAGLGQASDSDQATLERLNRAYEEKFGFPFILAVRGASLPVILESCRVRLENEAPAELAEALRQVLRIAHFRLRDLVQQEDSDKR